MPTPLEKARERGKIEQEEPRAIMQIGETLGQAGEKPTGTNWLLEQYYLGRNSLTLTFLICSDMGVDVSGRT